MMDVIQKENIEWEEARAESIRSNKLKAIMEKSKYFNEGERENQDIEIKRLRRIANFE